jgi:hypothetical protein
VYTIKNHDIDIIDYAESAESVELRIWRKMGEISHTHKLIFCTTISGQITEELQNSFLKNRLWVRLPPFPPNFTKIKYRSINVRFRKLWRFATQ